MHVLTHGHIHVVYLVLSATRTALSVLLVVICKDHRVGNHQKSSNFYSRTQALGVGLGAASVAIAVGATSKRARC